MTYRYPHFHSRLVIDDLRFRGGPGPGHAMPDFDLPTVDGGRISRSDFIGHKPLLLTMGSVTCPMTAAANPALKRLHRQFGNRVGFVTLYVREAHPGDRYPQPDTMQRKTAHARELKERDELPWTVAVDDLDGTLHQQLDAKPNAAYVMDVDGGVAFRLLWSDDREGILRAALRDVLARRQPDIQHQGHMVPIWRGIAEMDRMLTASGPTARRDVRRAAPPLYAMARMLGLVEQRREKTPPERTRHTVT
ncbi:deiodinase-like protein [Streptomyces sp. TRM64462]|uniref:deiodinase-like protein n=1 Tax=Streptomyces sp. TRM64462 TaxID=2741726 RepID=UPI00158639D2|nr:deiodinase-like protein [Streptomyces sp. TRM64462]